MHSGITIFDPATFRCIHGKNGCISMKYAIFGKSLALQLSIPIACFFLSLFVM